MGLCSQEGLTTAHTQEGKYRCSVPRDKSEIIRVHNLTANEFRLDLPDLFILKTTGLGNHCS